jgi:hypothetical protein
MNHNRLGTLSFTTWIHSFGPSHWPSFISSPGTRPWDLRCSEVPRIESLHFQPFMRCWKSSCQLFDLIAKTLNAATINSKEIHAWWFLTEMIFGSMPHRTVKKSNLIKMTSTWGDSAKWTNRSKHPSSNSSFQRSWRERNSQKTHRRARFYSFVTQSSSQSGVPASGQKNFHAMTHSGLDFPLMF